MYGIFKKAFFCLRITTLQTVVNLQYSLTLVQVVFNILHFQREWFTNGLSVLCSPQKTTFICLYQKSSKGLTLPYSVGRQRDRQTAFI